MSGKCTLCGGKLRNGICLECGMNNTKSDAMYAARMNQSQCQEENLTHIHREGKVETYKVPALNKNLQKIQIHTKDAQKEKTEKKTEKAISETVKKYAPGVGTGGRNYTYAGVNRHPLQKGKNRGFMTVFVLAVLIGAVLIMIGYNSSHSYMNSTPELSFGDSDYEFMWPDDDEVFYESDPYTYTSRELAETGEHWEAELTAGLYMVGLDIPEGQYRAEAEDGMELEVSDRANNIWIYEYFGREFNESKIVSVEDLRLFTGAVIKVRGGRNVFITSENAQVSDMQTPKPNDLTDTYKVTEQAVAGIDFPAGVYDMEAVPDGEFGYIQYELPKSEDEEYGMSYGFMMDAVYDEEYPEYCSRVKNIVLPEGTVLTTDDLSVELVPSERTITGNYMDFYNNAY